MYLVRKTKKYEKSIRRLRSSGKVKPEVFKNIENTIRLLSNQIRLDDRYRDHILHGNYAGYRECHIQGDLLLVYRIEKDVLILLLADIGSHSYLFG